MSVPMKTRIKPARPGIMTHDVLSLGLNRIRTLKDGGDSPLALAA